MVPDTVIFGDPFMSRPTEFPSNDSQDKSVTWLVDLAEAERTDL